jgi:hypothetical protein
MCLSFDHYPVQREAALVGGLNSAGNASSIQDWRNRCETYPKYSMQSGRPQRPIQPLFWMLIPK